jgi:hypothetical protein
MHDQNAYLKSLDHAPVTPLQRARRAGGGMPATTAADL